MSILQSYTFGTATRIEKCVRSGLSALWLVVGLAVLALGCEFESEKHAGSSGSDAGACVADCDSAPQDPTIEPGVHLFWATHEYTTACRYCGEYSVTTIHRQYPDGRREVALRNSKRSSQGSSWIKPYTIDGRLFTMGFGSSTHGVTERALDAPRDKILFQAVARPASCYAVVGDHYFFSNGSQNSTFGRIYPLGASDSQPELLDTGHCVHASMGRLFDVRSWQDTDDRYLYLFIYEKDPETGEDLRELEWLRWDSQVYEESWKVVFEQDHAFLVLEEQGENEGITILRIDFEGRELELVYKSARDPDWPFGPGFEVSEADASGGLIAVGDSTGPVVVLDLVSGDRTYLQLGFHGGLQLLNVE